jgi:hypothetical protein
MIARGSPHSDYERLEENGQLVGILDQPLNPAPTLRQLDILL